MKIGQKCDLDIWTKSPAPGGNLVKDIIGINLLINFHEDRTRNVSSRFHEDRTINVASRVLTRKMHHPGGHVFQPTGPIFKLVKDIIGVTLLYYSHVKKKCPIFKLVKDIFGTNILTEKNALPPGCNVCQQTRTIFEFIQDSLTKFHEDHTTNVASRKYAPPHGGYVFQLT
ncbi:hypothetical protein DPMN_063306 [Dreissena polymorpha]|uniref:Uncharacterized protein n=1 Tax=Dreissena polymorpha TaxID=45954 RepID=A0A9D4HIZ0_DREPO|nr:hypothetical protein DPMN_063306 [Dreissena polymorpha]